MLSQSDALLQAIVAVHIQAVRLHLIAFREKGISARSSRSSTVYHSDMIHQAAPYGQGFSGHQRVILSDVEKTVVSLPLTGESRCMRNENNFL